MARKFHYPERSVFLKKENTQNPWTFELGTQEGFNVPIWVYFFNKTIGSTIKI